MKTFEEFEALLNPETKGSFYVVALYEAYKMGWDECADKHIEDLTKAVAAIGVRYNEDQI